MVEFIAPAPVASYATAPTVFDARAPVMEHISPDPTVYAAPAPVVEHIAPALDGKLWRASAYSFCRTSSCR